MIRSLIMTLLLLQGPSLPGPGPVRSSGGGGHTGSLIQRTQNDTCNSSIQNCTVTITSTTAGTALVCFANNIGTGISLTSCTDSGDTFIVCSTSCNGSDATAGAVDIQYVLSGAGGKTSLTCNTSAVPGGSSWTCGVYEFKTTTSGWTHDADNNVDRSSAASTQAGVTLTIGGTCDVIVRVADISTGISSLGGGYTLNTDGHGNAEAYHLNTTVGTGPTYTLSSSGVLAEGALALKEGAGCS